VFNDLALGFRGVEKPPNSPDESVLDLFVQGRCVIARCAVLWNSDFKHGILAAIIATFSSKCAHIRSGVKSHVGSFVLAHAVIRTSFIIPPAEATSPSPMIKYSIAFSNVEQRILTIKTTGRRESIKSLTMKTTSDG
jgi:hypothetical protein